MVLPIKDVRSQGGGLSSTDQSLDADVRTICYKNFGFFDIYGELARTRGSIFRDFVRTSFMDSP